MTSLNEPPVFTDATAVGSACATFDVVTEAGVADAVAAARVAEAAALVDTLDAAGAALVAALLGAEEAPFVVLLLLLLLLLLEQPAIASEARPVRAALPCSMRLRVVRPFTRDQ